MNGPCLVAVFDAQGVCVMSEGPRWVGMEQLVGKTAPQVAELARARGCRVVEASVPDGGSVIAATPPADASERKLRHDLRAPLQGILGFAELLLRDSANLTPRQIDWVRRIQTSGRAMEAAVEKIAGP